MPAFPLPPGSTIGILGGGQLGRMLALAAARLGFDTAIYDAKPRTPAGRVSALEVTGAWDDRAALERFAAACDVVTLEFENVPVGAVEILTSLGAEVAPGARALAVAQDRVEEKTFLNGHGCPTVEFEPVDDLDGLRRALDRLGAPALLKTRREGYDGKGQVWVRDAAEADAGWTAVGRRPAILEARAVFVRELSVIAARGRDGAVVSYPLGENRHEAGVLRVTRAPAIVSDHTRTAAEAIARKVLEGLDYVGVVGVELFELEGGRLLVNEIAPRVHNTGHWTQDGCLCHQFEQAVRAVAGWPLGPATAVAEVEMTNLLGPEVERWRELATDPSIRLHLYNKGDARPGRKMAHANRVLRTLP
jgi:5-(carboxyamino)imidazole ribonucleotide synthase